MTKKQVIQLFKKHKIKTAKEARALGMTLRRTGDGAFRLVYIINPKKCRESLVMKFPRIKWERKGENLNHAKHEIDSLRTILKRKRYAAMRPFMPTVYYTDRTNGVILMERYYRVSSERGNAIADVLKQVFKAIQTDRIDGCDIEEYNIMRDSSWDYKLIDLGLML